MTDGNQLGKRSRTFNSRVPEPVRRELAEILRCEDDPAARAALFDEYDLAGKYGVSRFQFKRFTDRFPCLAASEPVGPPPAPAPTAAPTAPPAAPVLPEGYREWMTRAGDVLSTLARGLSADDPRGWERGVYLAMLARVFAVLAGEGSGLPVHEVLTVSRILLEHERAKGSPGRGGRAGAGSSKGPRSTTPGADVPAGAVRDIVRELYGLEQ